MQERVAIVAAGEIFGGVERQIVDLHSISPDTRPELWTTLFFRGGLMQRLRELGFSPEDLSTAGRYDPRTAMRLAAGIRSFGPGVIHAHGYRAVVTLATARRLGRKLPPVVKTEHGLPEPAGGNTVAAVKTRLNHVLDLRATRSLGATVCYVTYDIMGRYDDLHHGLVRHTVHNGIPPLDRDAYPRPDDLPAGAPLLGVVGRISDVKGIGYALEALAAEGAPDARIAVIGTGPLEAPLKAQAAAAGLADRVTFLGFRTNVYDYLAHIDALLMPSLHEGLPYTLLEAMSLGKPVLASEVGGLAEVLRDNETGLLFPARDPAAIARAVRRLVEEPDLGPRLGEAAAREQRARYTLDAMLNRYVEIYREAIARRG